MSSLPMLADPSDGNATAGPAKADSADNALPAPAATGAGEPASPRASSSLRAGWQRLVRWNARLEDSLLGDLIGAVCLFALGYLLFVMAGVLQ